MRTHQTIGRLPEDRDGFRFRGGSAVVDLTATLRARLTPTPQELLATPQDLDRWLVSAGIVASSPGAAEADLRTARALREAIFVLAGDHDGPALSASACKTLNRIAKTPAAAPALRIDGKAQLKGSAAQLLSTLARDAIRHPRETWDWETIRKGSRLGFRTAAVPKAWGGPGIDFVTQALVMAELAKADSAISKAFSQNWKWSHLIAENCTDDQKERFLKPFLADDTYVMGAGSTEPSCAMA